jgi:hypothetical protein
MAKHPEMRLYIWTRGDQMAVAYAEGFEDALNSMRDEEGNLPAVVAETKARVYDSPVTFDPSVFDASGAVDAAFRNMEDALLALRERLAVFDPAAGPDAAAALKTDALRLVTSALPPMSEEQAA